MPIAPDRFGIAKNLARLARLGIGHAMQVNMLEAKNQLSSLVKAALAGEEVIIAKHGKAQVKLVPCPAAAGLKRTRGLLDSAAALNPSLIDAAFSESADQEVAQLMGA